MMSDNNEVTPETKQDPQQDIIAKLQSDNASMQAKMTELLDETKRAKNAVREEAEAKSRIQAEKAQKDGDFEQLFKSSEEQRVASDARYDKLLTSNNRKDVEAHAMSLATQLADGDKAEILKEFIGRRLKSTEDGIRVVTEKGELTVSTLAQLKTEFEENTKFSALLRGNQSNGGGASGDGNSVSGPNQIKRDAFDAMTQTERSEFSKSGGSIIND